MNAIVQLLNTAGRAFVDLAVPMLIQSSVLIVILLAVNAVLRKRVRAVFRYWIWMLVLVKLMLPPSLWSPVSVGTWLGDKLEVSTTALLEAPEPSPQEELSPSVTSIFSQSQRMFVEPSRLDPAVAAPSPTETANRATLIDIPPALSLNWQGFTLLVWIAVVAALLLLLAQRTFFVQGLVAQADETGGAMLRELDECRRRLGLRRPISMRLSPNAASPAVCGLLRPVILFPQSLASRLHGADLQAVLYHELAHVQRGDLWINLLQTLLQIVYFYNPLLWLANTAIRRIREKAVDETVLVAMGEAAPQYPETLINVAKLALAHRPALSLRLIGVVESKSALTSRIQHILNRPLPKTARLGLAGLAAIAIIAAILLPMAAAQNVTGSVAPDASHDSDGDGLSDYDEIHKYLTDPAKKDSDGDGTPDGDWNERREYTYSVRTVLRYLPPVDEKALNDDFQDGRVLKQTNEYIEVEVIHYPLATGYDAIPENRNWRQDDAQMTEYLVPGATTNWDEPMRRDLIAALKADGIDVDTLTDKQVVERVSRWLLDRSRYLDKVFTTYYVHFPQGNPTVYPGLEDAFRGEFERDKSNYDWTLDQHFDHELLGKGMFYNKTHGSCTSTAIYLTTVLRALGIPTRIVLATPAVDASDPAQILMVKNAITHNRVRMTMLAGLGGSSHGFTNHTFNEVYVGGRWCRLDYTQLGCSNFGLHRFGLQTHVYTCNDWSDINLAPTWGRRYATGEHNDIFRHDNPYTAVEISELFGPHGKVPNPPYTAQELDPHPQPDIFLFYPSRAGIVWDAFLDIVRSTTANKTGRYQVRESYENLSGGTWLIRPQDILVLLFSLDTPERVPEGYEDFLPKPWAEIETQLQRGETVELSGRARGMNVIVLATPTVDGLRPLVQNSKLLRAIGGASPAPGLAPTQSSAISRFAAKPVKLANGATVELLGICEYPSEGKQWWRPDGSVLDVVPYRTTNNKREFAEGFRDYELVVRYGGVPDMDIDWSVPDSADTGVTGSPYDANGQSVRELTVCTVRFPQTQTAANLRIGVAAGAWETRAVHRTMDREGAYSLAGSQAVAFGRAHFQEGRTLVPVTANFSRDDLDFRVVAVRGQEEVCTGSLSGAGDGNLHSMTYLFRCPLREIKEFRVQTRPWTWVEFQDVALRPDLRTRTQAALLSAEKAKMGPRRSPGAEKVLGIGPAWEVLRDTLPGRYRGSIGGFSTDNRRCAEYFEKVLSWTRPGDAFVLMLAFDQSVGVPPEYRDLLPLPWAEIESRVKGGQTVEAQGTARDLTVIVLAAPTSGQLDTLVRQTHLLDPYRPEAAQGPTAVPSSQTLAQLPNGITVELLGACDYPSEGKQWWRPDGSPLAEAPYDKRGAWVSPNDRNRAPFELALRVRNLPENWEAAVQTPGNSFANAGDPPYKAGQRLPELRWLMMEAQPNQTTCTLRCDVVAPWQTLARSPLPLASPPPTTGDSVVFSEVHTGFAGGRVTVSGRDSSGEGVSVTVTGQVGGRNDSRLFGVGDLRRIVAITKDDKVQTAPSDGFYSAEGEGKATAYFPRLSLADVQEFQFQVRPLTWVEFQNVPLRRGLQTNVEVRVQSADASGKAVPSAGTDQEKEIVLPEADGQRAVMLDLATGELIPWPRAESPDRMGQAILKLGKGDLIYDCDLGDRSLMLLRGATSEQAQDTGEPSIKGHLIGQRLPEVLTVKTAEGRQYQVAILAADDKACTLRYSSISPDKGAGGGTRVGADRPATVPTGGNPQRPFIVRGTVTDESGQPMAGVEVSAHCGVATLIPTGGTVTDGAGRYTLSFGPGMCSREGVYPENVRPQAATIYARKAGFYEASLCHQGDLAMAGTTSSGEDGRPGASYKGVVLPNQPYQLDFVMRPAARIAGELVDTRGRPMSGQALGLTGRQLYPSTSVMPNVRTDEAGKFVMENVPLESFWFQRGPSSPARSDSIDFTAPGTWQVRLRYEKSPQARLAIASLQPPAEPGPSPVPSSGTDRPIRAESWPHKDKGALELRIAPTREELGANVPQEWAKALAEGRPPAGGRYLWVPVRPGANLGPLVITQTHEGKTWLLVHNAEPFIMVPTQGWRLARVGRGIDDSGRPLVMLEFDDAGMERLRQLTRANDDKPLAEIVNGVVVSAPIFAKGPGGLGSAVIPGNFTEQEINDMMASLRRGMVESPTQGEGSSPAAPSTGVGRSAGGGTPAEPAKAANSLELRIAPRRGELGPDAVEEFTKALAEGRSLADSRCLWVPVQPGMNLPPELVTQAHQGRTWLLAYNDTSLTMAPSQRWQLVHVGRSTDDNGRPMLVLRFDETGAEQMVRLTRAHGGQLLAMVVGGVVVSTPTIPERQEGMHCATITGAFTEQALADMTATLRRGMAKPSANAGGVFRPVRLRNGVMVELLGVCEHPSVGKPWWRPDGNPLTERPYDDDEGRAFPKPGEKGCKLAIRFSGLAGKDVGAYAMPSDCQSTNGGTLAQINRKNGKENAEYLNGSLDQEIVWQGVAFDQELDSFDLRVGVSQGPWKSEYRQEIGKSSDTVEWAIFRDVSLRPQQKAEALQNADLRSSLEADGAGPQRGRSSRGGPNATREVSGQIVDPNGHPVARAQVALCTEDRGLMILTPRLLPTNLARKTSAIVKTDAEGRFSFPAVPEDFAIIASHETGFARVDGSDFVPSMTIRLERWGQIEGTLYVGSKPAPDEVLTLSLGMQHSYAAYVHYDHRADSKAGGRFVFRQVIPGWLDIGRSVRINDRAEGPTNRRPIYVKPGQTLEITVGNTGRPVVGKLALPPDDRPAAGLAWSSTLQTVIPEWPKPAGFGQMTGLQKGQWYRQWSKTPEGRAYFEAAYHDPNSRFYLFSIDENDSFRIEDVIPGRYQFAVNLFDPVPLGPSARHAGPYFATIEVPPMTEPYTSEPLDLGTMTLAKNPGVGSSPSANANKKSVGEDSPSQTSAHPTTPSPADLSGRVVDSNGNPVAGAQVALCTKDKGVDIQAGQLLPTKWGGKGGEIVKTDAQGRFSFASVPDEFHLIAAHDTGFAWVTSKDLAASGVLRLEPWGRIEGTLRIGRELGAGERISLQRGGNRSAADQNIHLDYETYADSGGRFTFARVPPTWMEVGYLIRTGDSTSSDTGRTPIHLLPGQNLRMTLGGEGRPVIGKFVPPAGYEGPIYFGQGLRAFDTVRPDLPKPANYDQMTRREQQEWLKQWYKTAEAEAYYDTLWHDLNRRSYTFRIQNDGTFRIEDVIPGRYQFTVWLEERLSGQGRPEEIGAYYGTIEVPAIPGGRTDEPLDLGNLTVGMRSPPLHVGDMAPLFEAKSLDGKDIRLADYRGRFVLLSFWQPTFHPELERLKELHQTYGSAGKLAIVDFAGGDTLEEVKQYLAEHKTEWPEIYLGRNWDSDIFKQYGDPSASYILLVNPEGKIVATWLRGEKLTQAVTDAIRQAK